MRKEDNFDIRIIEHWIDDDDLLNFEKKE